MKQLNASEIRLVNGGNDPGTMENAGYHTGKVVADGIEVLMYFGGLKAFKKVIKWLKG